MGTFTYENQGANTFLVYSMGAIEQTDALSAGMIANNRINGVLAPGFIQNNAVRQLRYNISSKISLQQYFSGSVKKKQLLGVLNSITASLMQAEKYLMSEEDFVLDCQYIFVDVGRAESYLCCLPVERAADTQPGYYDFVRSLIYGIKFEESEDCSYVATLVNYINRKESFSMEGLLHLLETMEWEQRTDARSEERAAKEIAQKAAETERHPVMTEAAPRQMNGQMSPFMQAVAQADVLEKEPAVVSVEENAEKKSLFPFLGGKKKAAETGKASKDMTEKKEKKEKNEKKEKKSKLSRTTKNAQKPMGFQIPGTPARPMEESAAHAACGAESVSGQMPEAPRMQMPQMSQMPQNELVYNEEDFGDTVMMEDGDDGVTVMAGSGIAAVNGEREITLMRRKNGQKMTVGKDIFRIGKSSSFVDFYIGDNKTISRSHADILLREQEVYIQDNNSMNHTYVNGRMVLAGEMVRLSDGDCIRLSDEEFVITIKNG